MRTAGNNHNLQNQKQLLINGPQVQKFMQDILPKIQSWAQVNKTTIDMCNQQLEKMFRKVDVEQNKVLLEEEKTTLTTATEGKETKCDSRIEKETNKKQVQIDDNEYNMNRENKDTKNDEDGNDTDSNHISEGK